MILLIFKRIDGILVIVVHFLDLFFIVFDGAGKFLFVSGLLVLDSLFETFLFIFVELFELVELLFRLLVVFLDEFINFIFLLFNLILKLLFSLLEPVFLILNLFQRFRIEILKFAHSISLVCLSLSKGLLQVRQVFFIFTILKLSFELKLVVLLLELFDLISQFLSVFIILIFLLSSLKYELFFLLINFALSFLSSNDTLSVGALKTAKHTLVSNSAFFELLFLVVKLILYKFNFLVKHCLLFVPALFRHFIRFFSILEARFEFLHALIVHVLVVFFLAV